jgi:hypothetical protein
MVDRRIVYSAGLVLILAVATLWNVPHRLEIRPLPADWSGTKDAAPYQLSVFPDSAIYDGDWLGVETQTNSTPGNTQLQVRLDSPNASPLVEGNLPPNRRGDFWLAQWPWIWNSTSQSGWHTLFVNPAGGSGTDPLNNATLLQYPVRILPAALRPVLRQNTLWREAAGTCCNYYYLTGTESERDLAELMELTEQAYREITTRMLGSSSKLTVVFLPRLYGQGGLADGEGVLSYMDRNATGTDFPVVLTHEMVHLVAGTNFPPNRYPPAMLTEGWAVYITGGHYRTPEPLEDRAAVVYQSGDYIPLATLADSFYLTQHETAYIEAGAFVEFLIDRFGWDRVYAMFRDPVSVQPPSAALDSILSAHLQTHLAECESEWLGSLRERTPDSEQVQDVKFTVTFFDDLRRYQGLYTPGSDVSAMWIPDLPTARKRGMTADYLASPETAESIALETMFRVAKRQAGEHNWKGAWENLDAIEQVLTARQRRAPDPAFVSPLADGYRRLTSAVLRSEYEPLDILLESGRAEVTVRPFGGLEKGAQIWQQTGGTWLRVE